jgi:hypothetical protein
MGSKYIIADKAVKTVCRERLLNRICGVSKRTPNRERPWKRWNERVKLEQCLYREVKKKKKEKKVWNCWKNFLTGTNRLI